MFLNDMSDVLRLLSFQIAIPMQMLSIYFSSSCAIYLNIILIYVHLKKIILVSN